MLSKDVLDREREYGTWVKVKEKGPYDSYSEVRLCDILNNIAEDYDLEKFMNIRLMPQQPLDLFVEAQSSKEDLRKKLDLRINSMRFDFLFVSIYCTMKKDEPKKWNYVPVAVIEFDGPDHDKEDQAIRDAYKDGITKKMGAEMVRIRYTDFPQTGPKILEEKAVRDLFEEEILIAIVKGTLTKSVNYRKRGDLVSDNNQQQFKYLVNRYEEASEENKEKREYYYRMLKILYSQRELGMANATV